MVSVKLQGGLANQMFMTAFLVSYAEKHGLQYCIPNNVVNPHEFGKSAYKFNGLRYSTLFPQVIRGKYQEPAFEFNEVPFGDDVIFEGYFQSEKYFHGMKAYEIFKLPWHDIADVCAVHIRRGDYVKWPEHHPPVEKEYLRLAMDFMFIFFDIKKFRFFSDDIDWCKENFSNDFFYDGKEIIQHDFIEGQTELEDLSSLSCHQFMIGSNSAFSLFGHYLNQNENKFAIFPEKWFGPKLPHNTKDLYPEKSIQL